MPITNKATVTQWNEEKGFGFATVNGTKFFFHISALGHPVRQPRVGDTIIISSFGKTEKGARIEKGTLEGVALRQEPRPRYSSNTGYHKKNKSLRSFMFALCVILAIVSGIYTFVGKSSPFSSSAAPIVSTSQPGTQYTSKNEVAKYICENGSLPSNYVSKSEGKRLYEQKTGRYFTKWNFNPLTTLGVMIGGDYFENREGLLPQGTWYEADVDYFASNRGTNRLVYSSGCNIYYTGNHYKSFSKVEFAQ
ncbi:ribonuclease domain-containing protein [Fibrobacter sp. UWB10]|uniref:ribonuclease domain-containing protein n=1 Tax=Fibrobacter sp. UWB10 TaxID=1896201 RepID=UPI002403546E|nr:ribonuclease domain-containing protein [Fibrobacter sp. UWB10]SMP45834.1 ribonuclease [Fibrobacter sp. UWB10]